MCMGHMTPPPLPCGAHDTTTATMWGTWHPHRYRVGHMTPPSLPCGTRDTTTATMWGTWHHHRYHVRNTTPPPPQCGAHDTTISHVGHTTQPPPRSMHQFHSSDKARSRAMGSMDSVNRLIRDFFLFRSENQTSDQTTRCPTVQIILQLTRWNGNKRTLVYVQHCSWQGYTQCL